MTGDLDARIALAQEQVRRRVGDWLPDAYGWHGPNSAARRIVHRWRSELTYYSQEPRMLTLCGGEVYGRSAAGLLRSIMQPEIQPQACIRCIEASADGLTLDEIRALAAQESETWD